MPSASASVRKPTGSPPGAETRTKKPRRSDTNRKRPSTASASRASRAHASRTVSNDIQLTAAQRAIVNRAPGQAAGLEKDQLRELYQALWTTRRLEEQLVSLFRQGQVVGGVYRSLGQEATAVGCTYAMSSRDYVQPLIRDLGALIVHGVRPVAIFRQYMAKATSPSGGRDLNTHFSDPSVGLLGPTSMLGAMVPVIGGCLLASQLRREERAGLLFIGDGGSSTGAFYEGLNFAAVRKLPLIVVIEANRYAYSTPTMNQLPNGDLECRASGFGVPVHRIDGNDVLACFETTHRAREAALAGAGPSIIIADTYRRRGHAEHDAQQYVDEAEIADWAENNDPIERFEVFLEISAALNKAALDAVRADVEDILSEARDVAVADPLPDPSSLQDGVFHDGTNPIPDSSTWYSDGLRGRRKLHSQRQTVRA